MVTPFTEIYDLFLVQVQDYKIDKLFSVSEATLNSYLQGFISFAIDRFWKFCRADIVNQVDFDSGEFTVRLSHQDKIMLARQMLLFWMEREINNVLDMKPLLNSTDFKRYAESNNLRAMQDRYTRMLEQVAQDELDYYMKNNRSMEAWESVGFFI